MNIANLNDMKGGWFIGLFEPSVFKTGFAEVGLKKYKAGEVNAAHYHRIATEVTLVVRGQCRMGKFVLSEGDIVTVHPDEVSDFEALTDCELVIYKSDSTPGDKYEADSI